MKRSAKQFENQIKVIIVAALAKEFRRAAIIKKIVQKAKSLNQVATKGLILPELTGSIIPSREDRWLVPKDSVIVRVTDMKYDLPALAKININIKYGLASEYYWLTEESGYVRSPWHPDGKQIIKWIKAKGNRGNFSYKGRPLDINDDSKVRSVSYLISRSISKKGIRKTKLFSPFKDESDGVQATVNKALPKAYSRISFLYGTQLESSIVKLLEVFE